MADALEGRLSAAVRRGLKPAGAQGDTRKVKSAIDQAQRIGVQQVGYTSEDEEIVRWEEQLWRDQDPFIEEISKEWRQNMLYAANQQFIAYHRTQRRFLPKKTVAWRIRSIYNVFAKALRLRKVRLTENKPMVNVLAGTTTQGDIDKVEYKERLFWHLWNKLSVHKKLGQVRSWAGKCASGFFKTGWDPDAGCAYPYTMKRPTYKEVQEPAVDPDGTPALDILGRPMMTTRQEFTGVEEVYLDRNKQVLGPVTVTEADPDQPGEMVTRRLPPPETVEWYHDGEAFVDPRSPFSIRWDRFTDDLPDSWYIQDGSILSGSRLLALAPDKMDELEQMTPAGENDRLLQWSGLQLRPDLMMPGQPTTERRKNDGIQAAFLEKEFVVRETYIFPKDPFLRKLWGDKGALLITAGGRLIHKSSLPEWALKECPFIQVMEEEEEGNHYGKTFGRDLIPLQDDINRSRSVWAENLAWKSRILMGAPEGHNINLRLLAGLPGVMVTYSSPEHEPHALNFNNGDLGADEFLGASLAAFQDLANLNDASVGKLPAAGLAAKAIYALQYADERSISDVSNSQDESLRRLARSLDAITRVEYKEPRKIALVGRDRSYLLETEIAPEQLDYDVDYEFVPGSMLSRNKEALRNEMLALKEAGLIDDATVQKNLAPTVPDAFRVSFDLQEAKARRRLYEIGQHTEDAPQLAPDPWDNPGVQLGVFQEFLLSKKFELMGEDKKKMIIQYWQALQLMAQQQAAQAAAAANPTAPGAPAGGGGPQGIGAEGRPGEAPAQGAQNLEAAASSSMAPPAGQGEPPQ